ncbi:probable ubiquitin-conjugating enzyme E2 25 isoform X1 [Lactuca sativa]|uniref:probable ubiquitin-conjugating enzyme E2 25 isoform X1 n=1 Tax=Lactuca sativa TaxID=4236 RepID=UPI000CD9AC88|nr:probable ubiquitin-conjugating enzyme E2 25 isoform X1 [Lactuca sativa]
MESPAAGKCIPHKSKKRVFPESSSGTESKGDASSSPVNRTLNGKNKMHKQNEDTMVSILSGTSNAISKKVKSHNKEIIISPTLNGIIELDSEDSDSYNGKDYIHLSSDDHDSEYEYPTFQSHFDNIDFPTGMESSNPWFLDSVNMTSSTGFTHSTHPEHPMLSPSMVVLPSRLDTKGVKTSFDPAKVTKRTSGSSSSTCPTLRLQKGAMKVKSVKKRVKTQPHKMSINPTQITPMEDVLFEQNSRKIQQSSNVEEKYPNFKKFDIVEDYSDHHYKGANSETIQPPRNWSKKIEKEWRILEKNLPDTIFVRVYESRMDLLRAVIIGAEGTPYHNGLFFFDVFFPSNYPYVPPVCHITSHHVSSFFIFNLISYYYYYQKVYYHSGGLRINPNLYEEGKVCLSLLNTWIGERNENWTPGVSTMLQVLVSIQGLILNSKPYFNEPGFADSSGSDYGENQSMLYNERTLIYSLKTMVYTMKNPPKHFEDLVIGHFRNCGVAILTTCRGYVNGVGVGCGEKKGSRGFGKNVEKYMGTLVGGFKEIGVENLDEFVPQTRNLAQKIRDFFGI